LQIQDDGKGIDADILAQHLREGHWGLHGISERAKLLGANLEIWSQVGSGTEIELVVPASVAYPEQRAWRQLLFPSIGINHLRRVREQ
jgi:nitrate/nitrite-specific signal transduction histidine kinase